MLYTCSLICYGVASPRVFQSFIGELEKSSRVTSYAHRGAGMRSGGDEIATYADGAEESGTTAVLSWKRIWYSYLCRESCFRCGYHSTSRASDITIGDWWGLRDYLPMLEDPWGVSCAIVSTADGMKLLEGASVSLRLAETPVTEVANSAQPMLLHPPMRGSRDAFWTALYADGFRGACRRVGALSSGRVVKDAVKRALSVFKRIQPTRGEDEHTVDETWEEVPKVDFEEVLKRDEYPVAFAARNRDDEVRRMSSSGGVYHALASYVIDELGGVVYGCAFDKDLRATHIRCSTMAEAERCMGSKYSQSNMGDTIRQVCSDLKAGRAVLFTGTPCQAAAVRAVCTAAGELS